LLPSKKSFISGRRDPITMISAFRFWHWPAKERKVRAGLLCPGSLDVDLLGYGKRVIDLNAR
jgi:hypothetical protein